MEKLKPVIEFSKAHKFELICAGAALAVLGGFYWYLPGVSAGVKDQAVARIEVKKSIDSISNMPVTIDGLTYTQDGRPDGKPGDLKMLTPTPKLIDLKKKANEQMTAAKNELLATAQEKNQAGRVQWVNDRDKKILYPKFITVSDSEVIELVDKLPMPRMYMGESSERLVVDTNPFLDRHYRYVFDSMAKKLSGGTSATNGVVPAYAALETTHKALYDKKIAAMPAAFRPTQAEQVVQYPKERDDYIRTEVMKVANSTQVYVDPENSFHRRAIISSLASGKTAIAPTPNEIFEAYVDNWIQWDLVAAINDTNGAYNPGNSGGVTKSVVKRLVGVVVGPGAMGPFAANAGEALAQPSVGLFVKPPVEVKDGKTVTPTGPDPAFSLTTRSGDAEYLVVPFAVTIVCEPVAVGKFIDTLNKRNSGYTVLARKDTTVDPYAAASAGFLYGDRQCVQVELLVECAMLRSWLDQVMPPKYR